MDYSAAASSSTPPKKDDICYLLAHFSVSLKDEEVISNLQRLSKITPIGIKPHPRGAILAFKSAKDQTTAAEKPLHFGRVTVPLTPFPEIATPSKERGRRWRISGVPFWITADQVKSALTTDAITVTAVKLETVKNHPATRTSYATFWVKQEDLVPTTKEIAGEKILIFDPDKPRKVKPVSPTPEAASSDNVRAQASSPSALTEVAVALPLPVTPSPGSCQPRPKLLARKAEGSPPKVNVVEKKQDLKGSPPAGRLLVRTPPKDLKVKEEDKEEDKGKDVTPTKEDRVTPSYLLKLDFGGQGLQPEKCQREMVAIMKQGYEKQIRLYREKIELRVVFLYFKDEDTRARFIRQGVWIQGKKIELTIVESE